MVAATRRARSAGIALGCRDRLPVRCGGQRPARRPRGPVRRWPERLGRLRRPGRLRHAAQAMQVPELRDLDRRAEHHGAPGGDHGLHRPDLRREQEGRARPPDLDQGRRRRAAADPHPDRRPGQRHHAGRRDRWCTPATGDRRRLRRVRDDRQPRHPGARPHRRTVAVSLQRDLRQQRPPRPGGGEHAARLGRRRRRHGAVRLADDRPQHGLRQQRRYRG